VNLTTRGYLAISAAAALWGVSGVVAKYLFAERALDPLLLVQIRMGLAALLLGAGLLALRPRLLVISRGDLRFLAIWGILGMAPVQFAYLFTISKTSVATAVFLQYLSPIFTALWSKLVGRRRLGPVLILCMAMALSGSYLLLFGGGTRLLITPIGLASGLISALIMSFYVIYGARGVTGSLSPWTQLLWGLGLGSGAWLLVDGALWAAGAPLATAGAFTPALWGYYVYIAVLATIVPFALFLYGLKTVQPTQATVTGMLEPVIASLVAFLFLGEALTLPQTAGGALIVAAVAILQTAPLSASRKAPSAA
jgi:drug/metabolite transporter (DMT)-like permease